MKRCILHVGHPKTGSTHLQTVLHLNEEAFARVGFWVPSDFREWGGYHCRDLAEQRRQFSGNMQAVFEAFEAKDHGRADAMLHYILHNGADNLILSSELLFYYNWSVWDIARRAAAAEYQVVIIAYLARQDRAAIADYAQNIRNHRFSGTPLDFLRRQRDLMRHLQYADVLDAYKIEEPGRIIVRTFARDFLLGGDVASDFLAVSRCPLKLSDLTVPGEQLNAGLPVEWCEIMRGMNAAGIDTETLAAASPEYDATDRERLMQHYFRHEVRDYVLSEFSAGNQRLLNTYLADRSDAERAYWMQTSPAGAGLMLDADKMAECLNHWPVVVQ